MMNAAEFANIAKAENDFWWYRGMRRILLGLLDESTRNRKFRRVAEIGSGTGHFALALQQRYGWPLYPLDLGWEGLEFGQSLGVQRMVQADMCQLPYRDEAFDALVSMDVIVHLPRGREDEPMAEFARVLPPGGFLALRVSALDILRSHHSVFAHERQRFTKSRLLALAERHGFRTLRCSYANSLLLPVALFKFRVVEPLCGGEPSSGVEPVAPWLDRLLYAPLAAEAALLSRGINLPLGQSLILLAEKR
ncbi:MAG: class I SAM-dependent methyltransferase [Acidobacteria bacterium]|jgi:SAM-dependent methyltransferase|nr:class I SAM-dependent methyltransferase [Acidobacteriota bacterium]